jgi:hypothetical protein
MGPTTTTTTTTRELNAEEEDLDSCRYLIEPLPDAAAMFIDQVHLYFYLLFVTVLCSCSACSRIAAANDPGTTTRIYDFRVCTHTLICNPCTQLLRLFKYSLQYPIILPAGRGNYDAGTIELVILFTALDLRLFSIMPSCSS